MLTDKFLLEKLRSILDNKLFDLEGFKIPKSTMKISKDKISKVDIQYFRNKQLEQRCFYPTTSNFKFALEKNEFLKKYRIY